MDLEKSNIKIDKLNNSNFHVWKVKIRMVLCIRELDQFIDEESPPTESNTKYPELIRKDKKAHAYIGLSLCNSDFEKVQHSRTAREMWSGICDVFEKHTLLNKLTALRRFYTAVMKDNHKILDFAARIRRHASSLKSMGISIEDQDLAMNLLSGLPDRFDI